MALWLNRAGRHGEYEQRFLNENRIYCTWSELCRDLSNLQDKTALHELLCQVYPDAKPGTLRNWVGQVWLFVHEMAVGDWVVLPSKMKAAIHIGEIRGPYAFDAKAEDPYFHHHEVKWIATNIPRSNFDQDLLYSFGAFKTICRIERNDAEKRVRAMGASGWKPTRPVEGRKPPPETLVEGAPEEEVDLEEVGRDQIAKLVARRFKGHAMTVLVDALLRAQGYTTFRSPEGPDKGVDILAAPGPLGFGRPRIAVQVKSGDAPVDRPTLDQLIGAMQNVQADQGLLVSWGGFKSSVDKETAHHFFRVRLWDQDELIEQLLEQYANLDADLQAELPLKRIWTVALQEEGE